VVLLGIVEGHKRKARKVTLDKVIKYFKLNFVGIQETVRHDYPTNFLKEISGGYVEGFFWELIKGLMIVWINKWEYILLDFLLLAKKTISPRI
jgi:hypothetical protein